MHKLLQRFKQFTLGEWD